jgi:hypothetical protein
LLHHLLNLILLAGIEFVAIDLNAAECRQVAILEQLKCTECMEAVSLCINSIITEIQVIELWQGDFTEQFNALNVQTIFS